VRKTKSGEFTILNKYLIDDLIEIGLWQYEVHPITKKKWIPIKARLKAAKGSVQKIPEIPQNLKDRYKTTLEIPRKNLVDLNLIVSPFIDQTISNNLYYESKDDMIVDMTKTLCYLWRQGSKFASYYHRSVQISDVLDFTGNDADLEDFEMLQLQKQEQEQKNRVKSENDKVEDKVEEEAKENMNYQFLDQDASIEKNVKFDDQITIAKFNIDSIDLTVKEDEIKEMTNEELQLEYQAKKNSKFRKSQNAKHGIYDQEEGVIVQKGVTQVVECISCGT
jgi:ribonucleotide reductase alpha subunit